MKNEKYFIITDFGSSSIRTSIISSEGKIKFFSKRNIFPLYSDKKVEYNPYDIINSYKSTLKEVCSLVKSKKNISYGITSQRSSFLIWDRNSGKPLTPIISWQDGRANELIKKIEISDNKIHSITGLYKTPYYSAPKIKFLIDSNKNIKKAILEGNAIIGSIATYALWHISGGKIFVIDPTLAQRMLLFNIKELRWDKNLLSLFNIPINSLPEIVPTFPENLNISFSGIDLNIEAIVGDQQAAILPFISDNGKAMINYGTGAFLLTGTGEKILKVKGLINSIAYTNHKNSYYLIESTVNSCGTFLQWLSLKLNFNIKLTEIDEIIEKARDTIYVLPSIGGIGSPYWDYNTLTTFSGFNSSSGFNELIKGSIEGIAFLIAQGFNSMNKKVRVNSIIAAGGISEIKYLLQFQSDILGIKIEKIKNKELTSIGLASIIAKNKGYDISKWNVFYPEKVYYPQIKKCKKDKILKNWQYFFDNLRKLYQ